MGSRSRRRLRRWALGALVFGATAPAIASTLPGRTALSQNSQTPVPALNSIGPTAPSTPPASLTQLPFAAPLPILVPVDNPPPLPPDETPLRLRSRIQVDGADPWDPSRPQSPVDVGAATQIDATDPWNGTLIPMPVVGELERAALDPSDPWEGSP